MPHAGIQDEKQEYFKCSSLRNKFHALFHSRRRKNVSGKRCIAGQWTNEDDNQCSSPVVKRGT